VLGEGDNNSLTSRQGRNILKGAKLLTAFEKKGHNPMCEVKKENCTNYEIVHYLIFIEEWGGGHFYRG
jgi:hypothetical protein